MLRAQFDEHECGVDPGSNFSGALPKSYFILYFGKKMVQTKGDSLQQFC